MTQVRCSPDAGDLDVLKASLDACAGACEASASKSQSTEHPCSARALCAKGNCHLASARTRKWHESRLLRLEFNACHLFYDVFYAPARATVRPEVSGRRSLILADRVGLISSPICA
jgi:hypothetical protein